MVDDDLVDLTDLGLRKLALLGKEQFERLHFVEERFPAGP